MRKMTIFNALVVLVLCVVALGFYQGWFVLSSRGGGAASNKIDVNLTVDPDKARKDADAVESRVRSLSPDAPGNETPRDAGDNLDKTKDK